MKSKIGICGCGNMGSAILSAVSSRYSVFLFDTDKKKTRIAAKRYKARIASGAKDLIERSTIVILAVKPQRFGMVLNEIKSSLSRGKLVISVAAGISTRYIEKKIGKVAVVRVMPNMPAIAGCGISAICAGRYASRRDIGAAKAIFKNVGEVVEVKESLMDAVTAISGSGPAYFFYMVEVLTDAAVELGLKRAVAEKLAVETALGSAVVLKKTGEKPETLRGKVTSKGGTTEAAFKEFSQGNLSGILKKGIMAAQKRARVLGK